LKKKKKRKKKLAATVATPWPWATPNRIEACVHGNWDACKLFSSFFSFFFFYYHSSSFQQIVYDNHNNINCYSYIGLIKFHGHEGEKKQTSRVSFIGKKEKKNHLQLIFF
jgi:hypothetical protein